MENLAHPEFIQYRPWLFAFLAAGLALLMRQAWAHRRFFDDRLSALNGPQFSLVRGLLRMGLWAAAA